MRREDRRKLPALGVPAVNIAPEFATIQTLALLTLAEEETRLSSHLKGRSSNFKEVLTEAVLRGERWKKWIPHTEGWDKVTVRNDLIANKNLH